MKIAILTTFMEFLPGYSLTGIVKDQATMLSKYGNEVHLFVSEKYHGETFSPEVTLHKEIPFCHQQDYRSAKEMKPEHIEVRNKMCQMLIKRMRELDIDIVFSHDLIFIGWYLPYGLGMQDAAKQLTDIGWMHWVHSVPTALSDWWNINAYGKNHKIIYPNKSDRTRVAEQFRGFDDDVRVIPHIKDLRTYWEFDSETCELIDKYPGIMQADIVTLLPASVDRLSSKRVAECMYIFAELKALGKSVMFMIANQWATGKQQKEDTDKFAYEGEKKKLKRGQDFVFLCSDFKNEKYGVGFPNRIIRELFLCTNMFLFPTREESFGLVVPEAALSGSPLMVLNKSLQMQMEITGNDALYFEFGSYHTKFEVPHGRYWEDLARIIIARFDQSESLKTNTFCRQTYNMDNLYRRYYAPVMSELKHMGG